MEWVTGNENNENIFFISISMIGIFCLHNLYQIHWQLGVYSIVSCLLAVIVSLSVHYIILSAESFFMVWFRVIQACSVTDSNLAWLSQTHSYLWHVIFTEPSDYNTRGYVTPHYYSLSQGRPLNQIFINTQMWKSLNKKMTHSSLKDVLITAGFLNQLWPSPWF